MSCFSSLDTFCTSVGGGARHSARATVDCLEKPRPRAAFAHRVGCVQPCQAAGRRPLLLSYAPAVETVTGTESFGRRDNQIVNTTPTANVRMLIHWEIVSEVLNCPNSSPRSVSSAKRVSG